ncbi:Rv1355c family protein [Nocardia flavorosea]|uniref:Rv1355c family protein n=1 Tax=Nocardia flavorosea TaxID=53429 RepID=A0A846YB03_9NOCA|nr:Rv1355c family protein [Nocardia flavorosea]NKY55725.1 Rv1355c family protein [Nocardia flavorosea]
MLGEADLGVEYRPLILNPADPDDERALAGLRSTPHIEFNDLRGLLAAEFGRLNDPPETTEGPADDRWVYYPWRRSVLVLPGPQTFRAVRLDRNRYKLTRAEQDRLRTLTVGVVGQSVGHGIAYTLAQEGACGALRLADYDELELSNLNRVPATLFDIGVNKAIVTARRIAELDPYIPVDVRGGGLDAYSVDEFFEELHIVVEECDSLDIKLLVREAARRRRLPLIMETSDRGLLDVERFDLEPDRPPFHGLLGDVAADQLRDLSTRDKAPYVVGLLGAHDLSARMAGSLVEVGETLNSWPQLGGDVVLGAASVATAVRRIGLGRPLRSGRVRLDIDQALDTLTDPDLDTDGPSADIEADPAPATPLERILECAQRAPSGGNIQPWTLHTTGYEIHITLDPRYTTALDIGYRGSAVAVGAALYNARVAAAACDRLGPYELIEATDPPLTAILRPGTGTDPVLAADYPAALSRETNRRIGHGGRIPDSVLSGLAAAAAAEGAQLRAVIDSAALRAMAEVLAESDRVRYLTPQLHSEMFAEMRRPGDDLTDGIDTRSLELAADERAALQIGRRADVMAQLHSWSAGAALGDYARDRVRSSSAVVAVTFRPEPGVRGGGLTDYANAGAAVQRVWIQAQRSGLAVQPMSPVFLFSQTRTELDALSPAYADRLSTLQGRFLEILEVPEQESVALVLRLSYAAAASVRSKRRPVPGGELRG